MTWPDTSRAASSPSPALGGPLQPGGDPVQGHGRGRVVVLHDDHGGPGGREGLGDTCAHPAAADHPHDGGWC